MATRPQLVSLAEFAKLADVHPRSVRRWIAAGLITGYRSGPRLLKADLAELPKVTRPVPAANGRGQPE